MKTKFEFFFSLSAIIGIFLFLFYKIETNFLLFLIFCILFNTYPYLCLRFRLSYMHLFFSIFIWLGFYFKFLCVEIIHIGIYPEATLELFSTSTKNSGLIISSLSCLALILSLILYNKFPLKINNKKFILKKQSYNFLENYFVIIFISLIFLIISITYLNLNLSIYQKGLLNDFNELSFLNIPFKVLLIYGFSSLICLMIYFYNFSSKKIYFYYLFIFENFASSVSSYSRGMIFNSFSLIVTNFFSKKKNLGLKINFAKIVILTSLILSLFIISLLVVENYRSMHNINFSNTVEINKENIKQENYFKTSSKKILDLITKRFVGIDSVMLLSSKKDLSFELFYKNLFEKFDYKKNNFYEKEIIKSDISFFLSDNVRIVKTPGIVAFLFMSGSYLFLFFSLFLIGILLLYIERFILYFSYDNIYLCSLVSQVIVYRLMHFGLNPINSLLFFLPIIFILIFSYLITSYLNDNFTK